MKGEGFIWILTDSKTLEFIYSLPVPAARGGSEETAAINPGISLLYTKFHATSVD